MRNLSTIEMFKVISKNKHLLICLLIVFIGYLTYSSEWVNQKEDLPSSTETMLEYSAVEYHGLGSSKVAVVRTDNMIRKNNSYFIQHGDYVIQADLESYSNPSKVKDVYINPLLKEIGNTDTAGDFVKALPGPVSTVNSFLFGDGTVWDVEVLSYVIDYNILDKSYPTVLLPVVTLVIHTGQQERVVCNFTIMRSQNSMRCSELIDVSGDFDVIVDRMSTAHAVLLEEVINFISKLMFKDTILDAQL